MQRRRFVLGAGPTFFSANDNTAPRYAPHRPPPSAAGARLWIIRGCERPRYIGAIFSNCRHEKRTRLVDSDAIGTRDWLIASRIYRDCLVQAWLTAGRDSRARHLLTWNCQRIRALLMRRSIRARVLLFHLCRFFPFIFIFTFSIIRLWSYCRRCWMLSSCTLSRCRCYFGLIIIIWHKTIVTQYMVI